LPLSIALAAKTGRTLRPVFFGNRYRAAATHFVIGALLGAALLALVRFAWYPDALFDGLAARSFALAMVAVVAVGGPLALLTVFMPGKRGLAFDLVAIALLEATAVGAILWLLFEGRPAYLVFVKDRFELVRARDLPEAEMARAPLSPYLDLPRTGPRLVGARLPSDKAELERILFLGPTGVDVQHMPQHYVPFDAVRADALSRAETLARLARLNPGRDAEIEALVASTRAPSEAIVFLPLRAGARDMTVLLDRRDGRLLGISALRPWDL
jgi:hypothetical protein